ncbi:MAG: ABC transporter substrate-binding protein [Marinobacter sp.]|uniref:ABC transporter substrate-binding protein n=1 Tax=Marinobacter sp. TaxID=50741 RepID=UPI001B43D93B|nr:ABC transporter substrate-binding protein [Marinobacter sp.]MBQ0747657.1 ABC transporter substrate-binding protein [Marinobacter sp.]MBQ0815841.1 ABC transporter substrate-binding protein [Marinobacter sp.]|tara:strand:+ start:26783 stop:27781 length:999 start_codon:yes stop_codon:yes gene_type:complete
MKNDRMTAGIVRPIFLMWLTFLFTVVSQAAAASELKDVTLRLKWVHQAQFAGFYAAKEKGFYEDAGLNVEIRPGGVDFPAVQMVASGSEDFGITGADQILLAREKGVPITAVGAVYRKTPFALFAMADSGIETLADLEGKLVGVKLGGNEELTYRAMVQAAGLKKTAIREMPVKYDLSPLLNGQVQAWPGYVINEVISVQEKGHEVNVISPEDYGINFYADTLFTRNDLMESDPELVKAFVRASFRGWAYALENPEEVARFGLKYSDKLNFDHELAMMNASIPLLAPEQPPLGNMTRMAWQNLQEQLLSLGFLDEKQELEKAYTNEFLEQAK